MIKWKSYAVNPSFALTQHEDELLLGQTYRSAIPIHDTKSAIQLLIDFQATGDLSPHPDQEEFKQLLLQSGALVTTAQAAQMVADRRVAAFSLLSHSESNAIELLRQSHAIIAGVGGVGSMVAYSLAALGVGYLTLVDSDLVTEPNLNKSSLFSRSDLGKLKVDVIAEKAQLFGAKCTAYPFKLKSLSEINIGERGNRVFVWGGDESEADTYLAFARECANADIPITRGGVAEWSVLAGPTLFPKDVCNYHPTSDKNELCQAINDYNNKVVNPTTILTASIASSLVSNEAMLCLIKARSPPLHKRTMLLELTTLTMKFV